MVPTAEQLFKQVDFNGNGMLSLAEVDKAVLQLWPQFNKKAALMRAFRFCDKNNTGFLSRKEFVDFLKHIALFIALHEVFARIDRNGDGRISLGEFLQMTELPDLWTSLARSPLLAAAMASPPPSTAATAARSTSTTPSRAAPTERASKETFVVNLQRAMTSPESTSLLTHLFQKMDTDRAGHILFDEFCSALLEQDLSSSKAFVNTKAATSKIPSAAAMLTFTAKSATLPTLHDIQQAFTRADVNGNGMLSLAEIDKLIVEAWPHFNHKPSLMRAYRAADANRTGFISKSEFRRLVVLLHVYTKAFAVFQLIDGAVSTSSTGGDRRINKSEFIHGCRILGCNADKSDAEIGKIFDACDKNGGGQLLFDEFCEWIVPPLSASLGAALQQQSAKLVATGDGANSGIVCCYCGKRKSASQLAEHAKLCKEEVKQLVSHLPKCLRFPLPQPPVVPTVLSEAALEKYNAAASFLSDQLLHIRCTECDKTLPIQSLPSHFRSHSLSVDRQLALESQPPRQLKKYVDPADLKPLPTCEENLRRFLRSPGAMKRVRDVRRCLKAKLLAGNTLVDAAGLRTILECGRADATATPPTALPRTSVELDLGAEAVALIKLLTRGEINERGAPAARVDAVIASLFHSHPTDKELSSVRRVIHRLDPADEGKVRTAEFRRVTDWSAAGLRAIFAPATATVEMTSDRVQEQFLTLLSEAPRAAFKRMGGFNDDVLTRDLNQLLLDVSFVMRSEAAFTALLDAAWKETPKVTPPQQCGRGPIDRQ